MIRKSGLSRALLPVALMGLTAALAAGGPVPIGSLVGSRNATLDGQVPLPHTTMLSGDSLRVDDGLAMVTLDRGNRMILGRKTEASFSRKSGGVTVSLNRGSISLYHPESGAVFRVKAGGVTVTPAPGQRTLGDVAMTDGLLMVTVKDGTLQVQKAGATKNVTRGKTITIATTATRAPAPDSPKKRHVKHILRHEAAAIEALAATGVGAAIAGIALTRSSKQVSPVTPTP